MAYELICHISIIIKHSEIDGFQIFNSIHNLFKRKDYLYALYSILIATLPGIPRFMTLKSLVELLDDSYVRRRTYVNS